MLFIEVILPLALPQSFTYSVPDEFAERVQPGMRVIVPFGTRKFYSAIVVELRHQVSDQFIIKEIVSLLDDQPVVNKTQIRLWQWIASYYMCTTGEVMKAAIPSGLKLESETRVFFNPEYVQCDELTEYEEQVLDIVYKKKNLPISEVAAQYTRKDMMRVIQSLVDKEALWVEEVIENRYKPRFEQFVRLHPSVGSEEKMRVAFESLEKAPKQLDLLMNYIRLSEAFSGREQKEVSRKVLLKKTQAQSDSLNSLVKKNILEIYASEVTRLDLKNNGENAIKRLTEYQQDTLEKIHQLFTDKDVVLLHGITSCGKTELYIHLIKEQIAQGKQVLYLLPEIALTAQIITRLKSAFGNKVGIYHSKFSDAERVEVWNHIGKPDGYSVILGVRSSIFLPFTNLGLIIVDEEHENTYKQFDPAPRYHARDVAIVLASMHQAKTLLGTATPAVESYYNAQEGKYGLVEMTRRYTDIALPEIELVDISLARKQKKMHSHFHPGLIESISQSLDAGKQTILFQNRRGFAPFLQCKICEYIPKCEHCDVSLTYHKSTDRLVCHYCGYSINTIHQCPSCGNYDMETVGFGTEKIEDEIQLLFPHARIARLDLDSSRSRNNYEKIIASFENGDTDILVGTQMVSKGLNFDRVNLVGILNADNMLNYPDFRAYERSFQLMIQVSGRAGRFKEQGKVIIQTSKPQHPILQYVLTNDYLSMYHSQLAERNLYSYPPFYRLTQLTLKHKKKDIVHAAARELHEHLTHIFGQRVLGPQVPVISRVQTYYLETILLKIERQASLQKVKSLLIDSIALIKQSPSYKAIQVVLDVDPA